MYVKLLSVVFLVGFCFSTAPNSYAAYYDQPYYPNGINDPSCVPSVDYYVTNLTNNPVYSGTAQDKTWIRGTIVNNCNKEITLFRWASWCPGIDRIGFCSSNMNYDPSYFMVKAPAHSNTPFYVEQLVGNTGTCGSAQVDYAFFHDGWSNPQGPTCTQRFQDYAISSIQALKTSSNYCAQPGWVNAVDQNGVIIPNVWKKGNQNCVENKCYINASYSTYFGIAARGADVCSIPTSTPTPGSLISVTGTAFEDKNGDGCRQADESPISPLWNSPANTVSLTVNAVPTPLQSSFNNNIYSFNNNVPDGATVNISVTTPVGIPTGFGGVSGFDHGGGRCGTGTIFTVSGADNRIDIGFKRNISWFNVFDGDVYGANGYSIKIPPVGPGVFDNWMINGLAAGVGISSGGIQTNLLSTATNRTSVKPLNQLPGWQIENYPGGISYLSKNDVNFKSLPANIVDWNNLEPNKSYKFVGSTLSNQRYAFAPNSVGVATVYVPNNLNINGDFFNRQPVNLLKQGVLFIVDGNVTLTPTASNNQIDAQILSNKQILAPDLGTNSQLLINGSLYSLNDITLLRNLTDNTKKPAITIRFQPVYFSNLNRHLIKTVVHSWKEITPQ